MKHFKIGDKVTYISKYKKEQGIVKSISELDDFVFVVYNCGGDWDNYQNYTGASTSINDLVVGWI